MPSGILPLTPATFQFQTPAAAELAGVILDEHPAFADMATDVYPTNSDGIPARQVGDVWPVYIVGNSLSAEGAPPRDARPGWTEWCDWPSDTPLPAEMYAAVRKWGALYSLAIAMGNANAPVPTWRGVARFVTYEDATGFLKHCQREGATLCSWNM